MENEAFKDLRKNTIDVYESIDELQNVKTGKEIKYRISDYIMYMECPFKVGEIISITDESKKQKQTQIDGKWRPVPNEYNNMLDGWEIY